MSDRIPLMFLPPFIVDKFKPFLTGISNKIVYFIPGFKEDLSQSNIKVEAEYYMVSALVNSFMFFFIFLILLTFLYFNQGKSIFQALRISVLYSCLILIVFLVLYLRYPTILSGKRGEEVNKNLIFALKDLHLQIGSGVTLYNGLVNVANANYGEASIEIGKVAREISTGTPTDKALEKMAVHSKSDFLRRTAWQLINTLKAGGSLEASLNTLIQDLLVDRRTRIRSYIAELNLWILLYLFFAVVIPTIGSTMLIILSSFAGFTPTPVFFVFFVVFCLAVQCVLVGFIKTRRPVVQA